MFSFRVLILAFSADCNCLRLSSAVAGKELNNLIRRVIVDLVFEILLERGSFVSISMEEITWVSLLETNSFRIQSINKNTSMYVREWDR